MRNPKKTSYGKFTLNFRGQKGAFYSLELILYNFLKISLEITNLKFLFAYIFYSYYADTEY